MHTTWPRPFPDRPTPTWPGPGRPHEAPEVVNAAIADAIAAELIVGADQDLDDLDAAALATFGEKFSC